jgi:hypothetical protein
LLLSSWDEDTSIAQNGRKKNARPGEPEGLPDLTRGTLRSLRGPVKRPRGGKRSQSATISTPAAPASARTHVPPAAAGRRLDLVDGLFAPGGRLERVLPGYEPRAEQAALADAVATALSSGEHLLAEAGTGTG